MHKNLMGKLIKSNNVNRRKYAHVYGADEVHTTEQPHIRIEFDDIRDVPKVWVDGELIAGGLVRATYEWNTNDADGIGNKSLSLEVLDEHARRIEMKMSNVK